MGKQILTASMPYDYTKCPHRVHLDILGDSEERDRISPFVELLWERGNNFEKEVIDQLEIPYVNVRNAPDDEKQTLTFEAMANHEPLIYGGRISADDMLGDPDLLRLEGSGYVPGDIKSGAGFEGGSEDTDGKPKKHYMVQLGFYVDILERCGLKSEAPPFIWDIHGDEVAYPMSDRRSSRGTETMWGEYQIILDAVRLIVSQQVATLPALSSTCKQCHWRSFCFRTLEEADDLTLIPDLGRARRDKFPTDIGSVSDLAELDLSKVIQGNKSMIPGIGVGMLERYHARAKLQKESNAQPYLREEFNLPPSDIEIFFDVETDPLRDVCYLHGFIERTDRDSNSERYVDFYADEASHDAEKTAFASAVEYLHEIKPSAIYYYSTYERTTWRNLADRYPDVATKSEIEALFAADSSVDLFTEIVKPKMEWPTHDLSIKTLASHLGFKWRDKDPSGAASIEWYHRWIETGDPDIKRRILQYNEDDCIATRVLVDAIVELMERME